MDLELAGKRAFVAGASAGIGRAVAEALAAEGARVVLCARGKERLEAACDEIRAMTGAEVHAVAADVSVAAEARRAVEEAALALGGLDVLVTNSGGPPPGSFRTVEDQAWRAAVELLLMSAVSMVRAALPHLEKSPQPRVVMLASTSVKQPIANLILSNAVRAAVVGLAKTLSQELGPSGILVNVVCPGLIDTDRVEELFAAQARERGLPVEEIARERAREVPLGRIGRPEEMGAVVAFLSSARASYLTGTVVTVDGGATRSV
jgi:3-oxoacyl-[acyl-carrier protein] reductase